MIHEQIPAAIIKHPEIRDLAHLLGHQLDVTAAYELTTHNGSTERGDQETETPLLMALTSLFDSTCRTLDIDAEATFSQLLEALERAGGEW